MIRIGVDWADLMAQILDDFKKSPEQLAKEIQVSHGTIYNIMDGTTKSPSYRTIRNMEKHLGIVIDSNGKSYRLAVTKEELRKSIDNIIEHSEIPVVRHILNRELIFNQENIIDRVVMGKDVDLVNSGVYKVESDEMSELINRGDMVMFDREAEIRDNDIVICVTKLRQEYLRRIKHIQNSFILFTDNGQEPVILRESDIEAKYRVLRVIKDL